MSEPDDYLWDRSGPADPEVQRLEKLLAPLAHDRPLRKPSRRWMYVGAVTTLAAAAALVLLLRGLAPHGCNGFDVTTGGRAGCIAVGDVLDTGASTAVIKIADIGQADLAPNTKIRLDRSEPNKRQQIHLERGRMHAKVTAPPRIFAVTTPSTGVTDLGCEYTIEIDAKGKGWIDVQSGRVELDSAATETIVAPACTTARLREGRKPSIPMSTAAGRELRAAIADYEDGAPGAIDRVLPLTRADDAITLVTIAVLMPPTGPTQLACKAPCGDRELVLQKLAALSPPPAGVTLRSALTDEAVLDRWREDIVLASVVSSLEGCPKP